MFAKNWLDRLPSGRPVSYTHLDVYKRQIDDMGELGKLRVKKTLNSLDMIDFAILLITHNTFDKPEKNIIDEFKKRNIPFIIIHNKSDLEPLSLRLKDKIKRDYGVPIIDFSIKNDNVQDLIELIKNNLPETAFKTTNILSDIISPGDIVLLITPIDAEADVYKRQG